MTTKHRTSARTTEDVTVVRPATAADLDALAERVDEQARTVAELAAVVERLAGRLL